MLVYPQLPSGALSQFPVRTRHRMSTIVNLAGDGSVIKLVDPGAETREWTLQYEGLGDAELVTLEQFFAAAEGSLNSFTFLDPTANLLAWSGELQNPVWNAGPMLTRSGGVADPQSGTGAFRILIDSAGAQQLTQTVLAPGSYLYCLSLFARSATPTTITMLVGNNRSEYVCGANWQRISCSGRGEAAAAAVTFGIELAGGADVEVYGLQAEPQATPSQYKQSTTGGSYENARFANDSFTSTATDVNRHSVTVNIFHASHL